MNNIFDPAKAIIRKVEADCKDKQGTYAAISYSFYNTKIDDLWEALSSKERIPRWFTHVEGDLKIGGTFQIKDNASGTILQCQAPNSLSFTWEFAKDVSWVDLALTSTGENNCQLRLQHQALAQGTHFSTYGPGATGIGWDLALVSLLHYIHTQETLNEDEILASSSYKDFVSLAAKEWGNAAINAGFDQESSQTQVKACEEFYWGA